MFRREKYTGGTEALGYLKITIHSGLGFDFGPMTDFI